MTGRVKSPCNDVCQLERRTGYCLGCGRTGGEIMRWLEYTDLEREAVMARLPARLHAMGMPEDAQARREEGERRAQQQRSQT